MRNLPTYDQFINEADKSKKVDFNLSYSMTPTWWAAWKAENADKGYSIEHDAFSKTYEVSKDGKRVFVYDYSRYKIFTNERPGAFLIKKEISPKELEKIKSLDVDDPNSAKKNKSEEGEKSEEKKSEEE